LHQANQNLIDRVARVLGVGPERFPSNIRRYGNTSSASVLIAASEWIETADLKPGDPVCFAVFGAGFHWGALLARKT
jgi:3-oxoacyl-[acyl-carrier-protein] synthase-3